MCVGGDDLYLLGDRYVSVFHNNFVAAYINIKDSLDTDYLLNSALRCVQYTFMHLQLIAVHCTPTDCILQFLLIIKTKPNQSVFAPRFFIMYTTSLHLA